MTRRAAYVNTVADLSLGALHCHSWGHTWDMGPVSDKSPVGLEVWVVKLHCTSCGKRRTDYVTPGTYELEARWYDDPDGYRVHEPASLPDYRQEEIRRSVARQDRAKGGGARPRRKQLTGASR